MQKFQAPFAASVFVCTHKRPDGHPKPCCADRGGRLLREGLEEAVTQRGLEDKIKILGSSCLGACDQGPMVIKYPDGEFVLGITPADIGTILDELE